MVWAHFTDNPARPFGITSWACIRMDPAIYASAKKNKGWRSMAEVNMLRSMHCYQGLEEYAKLYTPRSIVVEFPSGGSKSQAAALALGMITGIVSSLAGNMGITPIAVNAMEAKKLFEEHDKGDSKEAVEVGVRELYPELVWPSNKKGETLAWVEHVFDAIGALLAVADHQEINLMRDMRGFYGRRTEQKDQ